MNAHTQTINTLPEELLAHIFTNTLSDKFVTPKAGESPLILCMVCKTWRSVALATPQLWSSLELSDESKNDLRLKSTIDLLKGWLGKSGACPLSLYIKFTKRLQSAEELEWRFYLAYTAGTLAMALDYADRWKDIRLSSQLIGRTMFEPIFSRRKPILETIHISSDPGRPTPSNGLQDNALLPRDVSTPWLPSLRSITVCGYKLSLSDVWVILCHSPLLEYCKVSVGGIHNEAIGEDALVLSHLRDLHIITYQVDIAEILGKIRTPAIEILHLHCEESNPNQVSMWTGLSHFLRQSKSQKLRHLTLRTSSEETVGQDQVINILAAAPSLEHIHIAQVEIHDLFLQHLASQNLQLEPNNTICPQFQILNMSGRISFSSSCVAETILSILHKKHTVTMVSFRGDFDGASLPSYEELCNYFGIQDCLERNLITLNCTNDGVQSGINVKFDR